MTMRERGMKRRFTFRRSTDSQVTRTLDELAGKERQSTTEFIVCLEEFDRRQSFITCGPTPLAERHQ